MRTITQEPPVVRPTKLRAAVRSVLRYPYCAAFFSVLLLVLALLTAGERIVWWQTRRHFDSFVQGMVPGEIHGNVLQAAAFRTPGVLPIYGSSELTKEVDNRADAFFLTHREGLRVFPVGRGGNSCLMILQEIAAVGHPVHGSKVAIVLSPSWFQQPDVTAGEIRANLTSLQLGAWMFSDSLSPAFKRRLAQRLMEHKEALDDEPLLLAGLRSLTGAPASAHLLALLEPVGWSYSWLLARFDACAVLRNRLVQPKPPKSLLHPAWQQPPAALDAARWQQLAEDAETRDRSVVGGTPYSVYASPAPEPARRHPAQKSPPEIVRSPSGPESSRKHPAQQWTPEAAQPSPISESAGGSLAPQRTPLVAPYLKFEGKLDHSHQWQDLALLIDGLKELGAKPVFICQPFNGLYQDQNYHGAPVRREFYDRLAWTMQVAGFPLVDFSAHEEDKYFFNDANHPSAKAWIYYDHALADFYHGVLSAGPR